MIYTKQRCRVESKREGNKIIIDIVPSEKKDRINKSKTCANESAKRAGMKK